MTNIGLSAFVLAHAPWQVTRARAAGRRCICVAEREAKLGLPKTQDNSSLPPSTGQKPSLPSVPKRMIIKVRSQLLVLVQNRDLEATDDGSERALRACAVCRKITNGFRQAWGAQLYADIRSVIETARRRPVRAIDAIRLTLRGEPIAVPASREPNPVSRYQIDAAVT